MDPESGTISYVMYCFYQFILMISIPFLAFVIYMIRSRSPATKKEEPTVERRKSSPPPVPPKNTPMTPPAEQPFYSPSFASPETAPLTAPKPKTIFESNSDEEEEEDTPVTLTRRRQIITQGATQSQQELPVQPPWREDSAKEAARMRITGAIQNKQKAEHLFHTALNNMNLQ